MKLHYPGETGTAICEADGLVSTTYGYRDVPFSDGSGLARNILVGICDRCGETVALPPQSTPAIKAAREKATVALEVLLPAVYLEALDLACYRIDPELTPEFRKRLLLYFLHRCAGDPSAARQLATLLGEAGPAFREGEAAALRRRFSLKVSPAVSGEIGRLMTMSGLNKTKLIKALVLLVERDVIAPEQPPALSELRRLAAVATG